MKRLTVAIITILFIGIGCRNNTSVSDSERSIGPKVNSLLSIMTLEDNLENLDKLCGKTTSFQKSLNR